MSMAIYGILDAVLAMKDKDSLWVTVSRVVYRKPELSCLLNIA